MADFDMWGPAQSGDRLARQDMQESQMNNLILQQKTQQIQQQQLNMEMQKKEQVQAQEQQAKIQEILQRNQSMSASDLGVTMIKSGLLKQGEDLLKVASEAEQRFATIDKEKAETGTARLQGAMKNAEFISNALENVHSQEDYNRTIQDVEQMTGTKLPDYYKNLQWNEHTSESLRNMATTNKEKLAAFYKQQQAAHQARQEAHQERMDDLRAQKDKAEMDHWKWQEQKEQKNSGNKVPRTPKEDRESVGRLIDKDYPKLNSSGKANKEIAEDYVAARAQVLLKNNPGLSRENAIMQAYSEAKQNKDFNFDETLFGDNKLDFTAKEPEAKQAETSKAESTAPTKMVEDQGRQVEARRAPDGKYYVKRDDGWHEVH